MDRQDCLVVFQFNPLIYATILFIILEVVLKGKGERLVGEIRGRGDDKSEGTWEGGGIGKLAGCFGGKV